MRKTNSKLVGLFLLLLLGCAAKPETHPFVYSQECPHVCWLNINPGLTTMEEARDLLAASKQVSKLSEGSDIDINNDSGFRIKWHTKQMGNEVTDAYVGIVGEDGIVSALNFLFTANIPVKNFVDLLGEPDEISVIKQEAADAKYVEYILYYTQEKVLIFTHTKGLAGPELSDPLEIVYINIDLSSADLPTWVTSHKDLRQPWLGFGKMDEYLARR